MDTQIEIADHDKLFAPIKFNSYLDSVKEFYGKPGEVSPLSKEERVSGLKLVLSGLVDTMNVMGGVENMMDVPLQNFEKVVEKILVKEIELGQITDMEEKLTLFKPVFEFLDKNSEILEERNILKGGSMGLLETVDIKLYEFRQEKRDHFDKR